MPTGKLYRNGLTMGAGGNPQPVGGKRGRVEGWTRAAVRRHTRWLYSVETNALTGYGWSPTLTLRECPASPEEWTRLRDSYMKALRRSGLLLRAHWVVEWQRRKVPHLHLAVYLSGDISEADARALLVDTWVRLAARYGAGIKGQHLGRIDGPLGWLEYLSKHAARGVAHYQRAGKPEGWETTGRLWGYVGEWPTVEPVEVTLTRDEFYRFRRLVRSWRLADARAALATAPAGAAGANARRAAKRRIVSARRMLSHPDRDLCRVRGVSEWIPEGLGLALLLVAAGDGEAARAASREAGARGVPSRKPQSVQGERW